MRSLIVSLAILAVLMQTATATSLVPAMFVFGDSLVDAGNNKFLNTFANAYYYPYGVNFDTHNATGRFSDGRLLPDYIASHLKLPLPPPYLSGNDARYGMNFGSASSGIDGSVGIGEHISFPDQISNFLKVRDQLEMTLGAKKARKLISRSIFYINIGNNDVNGAYHTTGLSNFPTLRRTLIASMEEQIIRLYGAGARKFVVASLTNVGCIPVNQDANGCAPIPQAASWSYNEALQLMLDTLTSSFCGINIVYADLYSLMTRAVQTPIEFGFSNVKYACCPYGKTQWCTRNATYCSNPAKFMYWDIIHFSTAFNEIAATKFWNGSTHTKPFNIHHLAKAKLTSSC